MDDDDKGKADTSRAHLYRVVAQLLHAHGLRDTLAQDIAATEREMGAVPTDLLIAISDANRVLLAVEAEVLDAAYAVIAANR